MKIMKMNIANESGWCFRRKTFAACGMCNVLHQDPDSGPSYAKMLSQVADWADAMWEAVPIEGHVWLPEEDEEIEEWAAEVAQCVETRRTIRLACCATIFKNTKPALPQELIEKIAIEFMPRAKNVRILYHDEEGHAERVARGNTDRLCTIM